MSLSNKVAATAFLAASLVSAPAESQDRKAQYLNPMLEMLDQEKPLFGQFVNYLDVGSDSFSAIGHSSSRFDFLVYDMEHSGYDVARLSNYLQWLLSRQAIAASGNTTIHKPVIVRIPANGREKNEWMVKNILDVGVQGIVFPFTETVEEVDNLDRAMRYPQPAGAPDLEPAGRRGWSPALASRYWGLSDAEYTNRADLWRKDPNGNILPVFLIESEVGANNARAIAEYLSKNNIGAMFWAGSADLGMSVGGNKERLNTAMDKILSAGREFKIPVAINMPGADFVGSHKQGARAFINWGQTAQFPSETDMKALGR
jgi:4-hydroxy-2-oxoheptanedioate aldolase